MPGRQGLRGLPKTPKRWRPERAPACQGKNAFETRSKTLSEDRTRARRARADLKAGTCLASDREIKRLIKALERTPRAKRRHPTIISMVSMRRYRRRIAGWLWALFLQRQHGPAATVHLTPAGWDFMPEQQLRVELPRLMATVRAALYRDGAKKAGGYLILFLDGEWAEHLGVFRLHLHGMAAGEMLDVVDRLRERKAFRSHKPDPARVVIKHDVGPLPRSLTYLLKPDWFAVWRGIKKDGSQGRSRKKRIKPPNGTLFRVWLHRWTIDDICLRVHLTVGPAGFSVTSKIPYEKGGTS